MEESRFYELMTRMLTGEASESEVSEFESLLNDVPGYRERYRAIKDSWSQDPSIASGTSFLFDSRSGLRNVWKTIKEMESASAKPETNRQREKSIARTSADSENRRRSRIPRRLTPSRDNVLKLRRRISWGVAAATLFIAVLLSVYGGYPGMDEPSGVVYATSSVEQHIITLPDQSVVRLNRNSSIEVLFDEAEGRRDVQLHGEAFFEVKHDPDRPFSVRVGDSEVRVHGTAFNVKEKDGVMVAVQEGIVSVHNERLHTNRGVRLTTGQLGLLAPGGEGLKIEEGALDNYLAWMNGYLTFDDMPFPQVVRQLERIFGIESELVDPGLHDIRLSVYTSRIQASEVIQIIAWTLDLSYEKEGNVIRWEFAE